jgi:hypothetical protein
LWWTAAKSAPTRRRGRRASVPPAAMGIASTLSVRGHRNEGQQRCRDQCGGGMNECLHRGLLSIQRLRSGFDDRRRPAAGARFDPTRAAQVDRPGAAAKPRFRVRPASALPHRLHCFRPAATTRRQHDLQLIPSQPALARSLQPLTSAEVTCCPADWWGRPERQRRDRVPGDRRQWRAAASHFNGCRLCHRRREARRRPSTARPTAPQRAALLLLDAQACVTSPAAARCIRSARGSGRERMLRGRMASQRSTRPP